MRARILVGSLLRRIFVPHTAAEPRVYQVLNRTRQTELASESDAASNGATRRKGLLGRAGLQKGEGLWIVPCEGVHTFGMKFAIDLVFLDKRHRVVKTRSAVRPGRISGCIVAHSVLELPAGTVAATQTQRGDRLELTARTRPETANNRKPFPFQTRAHSRSHVCQPGS